MNEEKELWERLASMEQDLKSVHRRLDNLETLTKSVHDIASGLKGTQDDVADIKNRVNDIETQPKKRYDAIVTGIITLLIGAVGGLVLAKLGLSV